MQSIDQLFGRSFRKGFKGFGSRAEPVEWCTEHYRLPSESSSTEGRFRPAGHQNGFLSLMASDSGPERIVVMKSARIGYSVALTASICYAFGRARRHVTIYQPSDEQAKLFAKGTVMPAIEACEPTRDLIDEMQDKRAERTNTMTRMGGKMLRILGAVSPSRFREYSADWVFLDETDDLKVSIGEEGDPILLAGRAIKNSPFRRLVTGGTPTTEGNSILWGEYLAADLRLKYHVPCPECGVLDELRWRDLKFASKEDGGYLSSTRMLCNACGSLWPYSKLRDVSTLGAWIVPELKPEEGDLGEPDAEPYAGHSLEVTKTGPILRRPDGSAVEWPGKVALGINALYSPWWPWKKAVSEFLEAKGSAVKMTTFTNHVLGEPWRDRSESVYPADLAARRERLMPLPPEVRKIVVGVDVQGEHLSVLLTGWCEDMTACVLDRMEFHGPIDDANGLGWTSFMDWLRTRPTWDVQGGGRQGIDGIAIDSGFATMAVYAARSQIQRLVGRRCLVFAVKGMSGPKTPVIRKGTKRDRAGRQSAPVWYVGDYQAGRETLTMLARQKVRVHEGIGDDVILELCAMDLVKKKLRTGGHFLELAQTFKRNEAFDCLKYAMAITRILGSSWRPTRIKEKAAEESEESEDAPDEDGEQVLIAEKAPVKRARRRVPRGRRRTTGGGRRRPILC